MVLKNDQGLKEWCGKRSIVMDGLKLRLENCTEEYLVIEVPQQAESQMYLAGDLISLGGFSESSEDMIWISQWDKWNDWNQDLGEEIITRLRRADNESLMPLEQFSMHICAFQERKVAVAIWLQVMIFRWDGWLASAACDYLVQCTHDGLIWITSRSFEIQESLRAQLSAWSPLVRPFLPVKTPRR